MPTQTDTAPAVPGTRHLRPRLGAAALVSAAVLLAVSAATQVSPGSGSDATRLAVLDAAGARAWISGVTFVLAQLPMPVALLAIGALVRPSLPRLGAAGVVLGVVGAFGEAVNGGVTLTCLLMAQDQARRSAYAHLYGQVRTSPLGLFALLGLIGSVLGLLLLSIALFRARVGPRWVGPALWLFLALEYVGSAASPVLGYLGVAAALAAFLALAREAGAGEDLRR